MRAGHEFPKGRPGRQQLAAAVVTMLAALGARAQQDPPAVPDAWTCLAFYYEDESCDCGCGAPDPACESQTLGACAFHDCAPGLVPDADEPSACVANVCGDGVRAASEACDDGDAVAGGGCAADCAAVEDGFSCTVFGCAAVVCGDGALDAFEGETCDDGNADAGDGCDDLCQTEAGFVCPVAGEDCAAVVCGDGDFLLGIEGCDDGNDDDGDGCSAACVVEDGFTCPLTGGACSAVPDGWLCDPHVYGANDGCDCGCGVEDVDCCAGSCTAFDCTAAVCDFCNVEGCTASPEDDAQCHEEGTAAGEGEGEGEPAAGEGEGEGEAEREDASGCAATPASATALLAGLALSRAICGPSAARVRRPVS